MRYPKDVLVWEHAPGRKLVEVVVTMKNVKGALADVASAIAESGINVLSGFVTARRSSSVGRWSFFADITDSTLAPEDIIRTVGQLPKVQEVEVVASEDGFLVDSQHFPVKWSGRKVLLLRTDAMAEMISRLWQVFGSAAAVIIDQMSEAMGGYAAQEVIEDFGKDFVLKNLPKILKAYSALGYGEVKVQRYEPSKGLVEVDANELFECEGNKMRHVARQSTFFRAHLRGFVSTIFDSKFLVTETQCVAMGDETCSFIAKKLESAEMSAPNILGQISSN